MSINLSEDRIGDFCSCVHHELLSYVRYPAYENGPRCFAYPQFLVQDDQLTPLLDSAFPENGCLPMVVMGTSVPDMEQRYGHIVVMMVNDGSPQENRYYPSPEPSKYNSIIKPSFQKGKSAVEFTSLSRHRLSASLMQVLEVQERIDFSKPLDHPVHLYSGQAAPQTNLALIAQTTDERKRFYGPFECTCGESEEISLRASSFFGMRIASFSEASFVLAVELVDEKKDVVARLVDAEGLSQKFINSNDIIDWISDTEMLDALGRIARTGEDPFSKSQMRALKTEISKCLDEAAKIELTPQRRERMSSLLDVFEDWSALPDKIQRGAIEKARPEQLAEYVLDNDHFEAFFEKVIENSQIRDQVERDTASYQAQADEAKQAMDEAMERRRAAQEELASCEEQLAAKTALMEQEVRDRTRAARHERDVLLDEISGLTSEKRGLEEAAFLIERQIRCAVEGMSDQLSTSSKILESELIRQIVASVNADERGSDPGEPSIGAGEDAAAPAIILRADERDMDPSDVLSSLERPICDLTDRDLSRNDIANIMVCLTQGYILTFAGFPGTGKTSLAKIIAGALGLTNRDARRFVEIGVERGWTSYKDFIGYYNPLTKTMEKSNATAFDAFSALDAESRANIGAESIAPYIFLLDEANLSSLEHYWSPFLHACDSFKRGPFDLSLGGSGALSVPSYVRFIATVNFDHTTEELSPRFLDRSWIVTLDPNTLDIESDILVDAAYDFVDMPAFSFAKLLDVFGVKRDAMMRVELRSKLKEVLDLCSKHHRPVSPRSKKMVWGYVCTAERLMSRSTAQSSYAPVDYAATQKILPALSGADEKLEELLRDLDRVNGLPIMKARVQHMLEVGNDSGYYQYFA